MVDLASKGLSRIEGNTSESIGREGKFTESCGRELEGNALEVLEEVEEKAGENKGRVEGALRRPGENCFASPRGTFSEKWVFKDSF